MPAPPRKLTALLSALTLAIGGLAIAGPLPGASAAGENLALNRPVQVSSSESAAFGGAAAVDGSATSRWASQEGHDPEWISVDLGSAQPLRRAVLRWEAAYASAYRIEVSADGTNWTSAYSTTTGDGGTDDVSVTATGRYVRVYGTKRATSYGYSLWELELYGDGGTTPPPTTPPPTTGGAVPFGSHLKPYVTGTLKPSGAQSTVDQAVVRYYEQWRNAFVKQNCGNGWYEVISPDADHPYVAEGQGYGLVVSATMAGADPNAKKIFDGILKFVLAHKSVNDPDLAAAEQDTSCKSVNGSDSATDGDLDIAYGLLLADRQWGSSGTYDYRALALKRINAIKRSEVDGSTHMLLAGDWASGADRQISRSSDWMIGHMRAFRQATGDTTWDTIREKHQNVIAALQRDYAGSTGLLPDFVQNTTTTPRPAQGKVLEDPNDGAYWWNACRDPWRLGVDAATTGDARSTAAVRKLSGWIRQKTGGDPAKIKNGYTLGGSQLSGDHDAAFWAPFAVAALSDPGAQAWLDALWAKLAAGQVNGGDYYSASIHLQTMIAVSGNFWRP
ncbi:glycosyl hydrolase family 8 [Actinomadura macrotermitis]|uniref:F5/8 type C domain-containing protein n=1 Tax=Actinomadura macrotermitis TaxID=2585200 RepID=A0A7K0C351_9ACTN|nr:hypothetical protein [Actinomadura macrotermitis]